MSFAQRLLEDQVLNRDSDFIANFQGSLQLVNILDEFRPVVYRQIITHYQARPFRHNRSYDFYWAALINEMKHGWKAAKGNVKILLAQFTDQLLTAGA